MASTLVLESYDKFDAPPALGTKPRRFETQLTFEIQSQISYAILPKSLTGFGEDPFLSGEMAYQVVKGMQGDDPRYLLMNAGPKHFAAFDGPGNGGNAAISDSDWIQTYLHPFRKAFQAGAMSTMCTYAEQNGVHGCEDPKLLTSWLREKIGFNGYVISDQGAIHDPSAAIRAGCDVEDGWGQYVKLKNLSKSGDVKETDIDKALSRLFEVRMRHGEFDPPRMVPYANMSLYGNASYDYDFYRQVSLDAARQSITLLKNSKNFLPLNMSTQPKIAVFGIESNSHAQYETAPGRGDPPSKVTILAEQTTRIVPTHTHTHTTPC